MVRSDVAGSQLYDVIVVGAGAVGAALAWKLVAEGYRVCICDGTPVPSPGLRVEHLSHPCVELFRELDLLDRVRPALVPLDATARFRNGHLSRSPGAGGYVVCHDRLIQVLRHRLDKVATFLGDSAVRVSTQGRVKSVVLQSGRAVCGWMVAVASGADRSALDLPGLREEVVWKQHSLTFAWDLELAEPDRMTHPSLVFRTTRAAHGYGYLKLFGIREKIRANFFTYWRPDDARRRELTGGSTMAALANTVEGLREYLGESRVTSGIEEALFDLTRVHGGAEAGLVLLGDACGQVAPTAGMGLRKGLNDVKTLAGLMAGWQKEPEVSRESLEEYYRHPSKTALDEEALATSIRERRVATDWKPEWVTRYLIGDRLPVG